MRGAEVGCATEGDFEVSVPRGTARIDGVFHMGALGGFFGPLEPSMAHRLVAFEAYSGGLPRGWLGDACMKAGWMVKRWRMADRDARHGTRPPVLVVISARRFPRGMRVNFEEPVAPGVWRSRIGAEVELLFVELAAVPLEFGTTGLHMLRLPSDHERAGVFDLFLEDPTIEPGIRAAFREAIMNGTIPSTETEYRTATERVLAEGERRGERKGYRRGKVQGIELARRTIIERIRVLLGDEAAASLEHIADFDALSARAFEMLAEQR
jgi:hypothetical protein